MDKRKKQMKPLPRPTKKLYKCYDFTFYHEGKTLKKPEPVNISFSELLLNPDEECLVMVRSNLQVDKIAKLMRESGHKGMPMCDGAMNYGTICNRRATYLCDESGGGNPSDRSTWVWYKIDNTIPNNKIIPKLDLNKQHEVLTFEEADKIPHHMKFEFDGSFTDLIKALEKEGFKVVDERNKK
jgi:hypothetical protein